MALHSKYNPQGEADRFVKSLSGSPDYIVITEPGESYTAKSFRAAFPKARLIAIRYTDNLFLSTDVLWDFVYRPVKGNLIFFLLNIIPDSSFGNTLFLSWKPSDIAWPEIAGGTWNSINETLQVFKSLIYTRASFGKVWFKNICNNFWFSRAVVKANFSDGDFGFVAAGRSLENLLSVGAGLEGSFLCAGSSYKALSYYKVPIAACISTDGGFWASQLISGINKDIPIFLTAESAIPKSALEQNPLVFLSYGSELEKLFFDAFRYKSLVAKRNGTVSGTAIELLLNETTKNIYSFGLDLSSGKGFSHARPHQSMKALNNSTRLKLNPETFSASQRFENNSLSIYSSWFSSLKTEKSRRIFRVALNRDCAQVSGIKSITLEEFRRGFSSGKIRFEYSENLSSSTKKNTIKKVFKTLLEKCEGLVLFELVQDEKDLSPDKRLQKELVEMLAYSKFLSFIKNKTYDIQEQVKSALENELKLLMERFGL